MRRSPPPTRTPGRPGSSTTGPPTPRPAPPTPTPPPLPSPPSSAPRPATRSSPARVRWAGRRSGEGNKSFQSIKSYRSLKTEDNYDISSQLKKTCFIFYNYKIYLHTCRNSYSEICIEIDTETVFIIVIRTMTVKKQHFIRKFSFEPKKLTERLT